MIFCFHKAWRYSIYDPKSHDEKKENNRKSLCEMFIVLGVVLLFISIAAFFLYVLLGSIAGGFGGF